METLEGAELCFPQLRNTSCRKLVRDAAEAVFLYIFLSCMSLLTVILNLLVIISISHFRQLHKPTNLLLLSLAVSDFLVGLLLMPAQVLYLGGCWFLGSMMCGLFYYASFIVTSASVGNMVLISIDRYVAICHSMCYTTKVTHKRVQVCICLCWSSSVFYDCVILNELLKHPERLNSCYGECVVVLDFITGALDVWMTFIGPISVIVVLYVRVFMAAVSQARVMRSRVAAVSLRGSVGVTAKRSERKAAKTLGVVVVVFVICFCPSLYLLFASEEISTRMGFSIFTEWLLYFNSCLNPVVYVFYYPWLRRSIKRIVTLQIL
ncbi:trace amine-associated receptor 13c-like [Pungitius pungitius]|uniref:trace amine-associated receptor 13c-like n=1 Tax=Pungitius pungitius TaxID=134920 RepID=UPI002E11862C